VKGNIYAHGLGRHSRSEIAELGSRSVASLAVMIGEKPYLMGDKPCGADATAFAFAVSVLTPFFAGPLHDAACLYPQLLSYTGRLMQQFYPELAKAA
jgi:glutathione S-transferase